MRKIDLIEKNIEEILEWSKINSKLCRLGIDPTSALRFVEIHKKVNMIIADGYSKREAFNIISKREKQYKNLRAVESLYYQAFVKVD